MHSEVLFNTRWRLPTDTGTGTAACRACNGFASTGCVREWTHKHRDSWVCSAGANLSMEVRASTSTGPSLRVRASPCNALEGRLLSSMLCLCWQGSEETRDAASMAASSSLV